jgi:hypothetical protein
MKNLNYKNDIILMFMCGDPEVYEEQFKTINPKIEFRWKSRLVANVVSNTTDITNIKNEVEKKFYPNDPLPCIIYIRREAMLNINPQLSDFKDINSIKKESIIKDSYLAKQYLEITFKIDIEDDSKLQDNISDIVHDINKDIGIDWRDPRTLWLVIPNNIYNTELHMHIIEKLMKLEI